MLAIVVLVAGCIDDTSPLHIRRKKLLSVFDEVAFSDERPLYIDTPDPVLFIPSFFPSVLFFFCFTVSSNFFSGKLDDTSEQVLTDRQQSEIC